MAESETEEQPALVCWFLPETEGRAVEDIINHFGYRAEPNDGPAAPG